MIANVPQLLTQLGGPTEVARSFAPPLAITTVHSWIRRARIPVERWDQVINVAEARGIRLTADDIRRINAPRKLPNTGECA